MVRRHRVLVTIAIAEAFIVLLDRQPSSHK
jgi:hypothetical protein